MTSGKLLEHWQAPAGAGRPVGLLATSFTFDTDFFENACLGRFLGLDTQRGEGDPLLAVIEEEERLAEVRAAIIVDRSERPGGRNLRWDLLTVAQPRGLQHSKTALLVWERVVRVIISSANLTNAGYRSQVEVATVFDAFDGASVPRSFFTSLLGEVRKVALAAPGDDNRPGPKLRALQTIADAERRLVPWRLPTSWGRNLRAVVAPSRPGLSPLDQVSQVWSGPRPRKADVLSPFFDIAPGEPSAVARLADLLAQKGPASVRFCLPWDSSVAGLVVRAPEALAKQLPRRIDRTFELFAAPGDEPRRLHAKALVLASDEWVAALVGSSNFTVAGLGLDSRAGHLELNVWFGAPAGTEEAKQLLGLVPTGDAFDPATAVWEPELDDDTPRSAVLPIGFADCLLSPHPDHPTLRFIFDSDQLPATWRITLPGEIPILTDEMWSEEGRHQDLTVAAPAGRPPFFVDVIWSDSDGEHHAPWAVNVTDPGALPPPDELRHLPADALLAALASSRPMHEAIVAELRRRLTTRGLEGEELDPLKRFTTDGLFKRTRRLSAALTGMQQRLERPVSNPDALIWRLRGPFGPVSLAKQMLAESATGGRLPGEAAFSVAEIALALSWIDWGRSATPAVSVEMIRKQVDEVGVELTQLVGEIALPRALADYVQRALQEAQR